MAVTVTPVAPPTGTPARKYTFVADVIKGADADTTVTITHGLGLTPQEVFFEPLLSNFYLSNPFVSTVNGTQVVITTTSAVGSGNAAAQFRVHIKTPYSQGL